MQSCHLGVRLRAEWVECAGRRRQSCRRPWGSRPLHGWDRRQRAAAVERDILQAWAGICAATHGLPVNFGAPLLLQHQRRLWSAAPLHYEIWNYYQSTSKVHANVLQTLFVPCLRHCLMLTSSMTSLPVQQPQCRLNEYSLYTFAKISSVLVSFRSCK